MKVLTGKNILLISPEPWNYIFVSKHHYAKELARKGNTVYFLNPPSSRKGIYIQATQYTGIFAVDYPVTFRGQRFLPGILRRAIDAYTLRLIEKKAGHSINVIWNFENSRFYDLNFLSKNIIKVYHQVDLNQDFHVSVAAATADICFCTTDFIKEKLLPFNRRTFKVHHGFSGMFSEKAINILKGEYQKQQASNSVKAYYIGNLDISYLDIDLLEHLIQKNSDVDFVFVGPYLEKNPFYQTLTKYKNVCLKGQIKGEDVPNMLDDANILLLLYKAEEYREQLASPHKVLEYLASGKVIVGSYTDEYKDKRNLLIMADQRILIVEIFDKVKANLDYYNSVEMMQERVRFAKEHSYQQQLEKIESLIYQHCLKK